MVDLRKTMGRKIAVLRNQRGWSQAELGGKIGYSQTAVSAWERDQVKPYDRAIQQLERLFGEKLRV